MADTAPCSLTNNCDVSINAVNRSEQDNYKCAVVRFNAMNFNSSPISVDMMNNDDLAPIAGLAEDVTRSSR